MQAQRVNLPLASYDSARLRILVFCPPTGGDEDLSSRLKEANHELSDVKVSRKPLLVLLSLPFTIPRSGRNDRVAHSCLETAQYPHAIKWTMRANASTKR